MRDQHWKIVNFLRHYYKQFQIAPMVEMPVKTIEKNSSEKKGNIKYLFELFPG